MKLNIYAIFDTAAGLYGRPIHAQADAEAIRAFKDIAVNADHDVGKHPEDYSIHRLGIYDDNNGNLTDENNECLMTGLEAVAASRTIDTKQIDALDESITSIGGTA